MIQTSWGLPILYSATCGLVLGVERMLKGKPASLKTQMLVCMGSCLYTLISIHLSSTNSDITRILGQVVTGVGFLGAGVILREVDNRITGITTAAIIWVNAAVGMICGLGFGKQGVILCIITVLVLILITFIEKKFQRIFFKK